MKVLFIGDVIGIPGYDLLKTFLPSIKSRYHIDFVVANAENITDGMGMLEKDALELLKLEIDVLTGGNHTMDKIQSHKFINENQQILRPLNYPKGAYGKGFGIFDLKSKGLKIAVVNLQGRVFMRTIDCPFRCFDSVIERIKAITNLVVVDFHAETTSEKVAFGWYADGRASAVIGTHTHIQTSDERILPGGTAYITDVGMTGAYDSVIGMKKEQSIKRFVYATPQKHEVAKDDLHVSGAVFEIDNLTGKAKSIERLFFPAFNSD